jgi:hypothetical protein
MAKWVVPATMWVVCVGAVACVGASAHGAGSPGDGGVSLHEGGVDGGEDAEEADEFSVEDLGDVTLPGSPQGMDVDQMTAHAYVAWAAATGSGVSVIDMTTGQITGNVDLPADGGAGAPLDVGVDPTNRTAYVSTPSGLLVLDEASAAFTGSIATTAPPVALAVDASLNRIYAYDEGTSGTVDVVDGASNDIVTSIPTMGFGFPQRSLVQGFLVVSSFTHHVWAVGASNSGSPSAGVTEIDGTTNQVVGTKTFPGTPVGAGIDLANDDVFVTTVDANGVPSVNETKGAQSVLLVGCSDGYLQAQVLGGGYTFLFSQPGLAGCAAAGGVTGSVIEACGYDGPQTPDCSDPLPVPFLTAPEVVTRMTSYFLPDDVVSILVESGEVSAGIATTQPALRWLKVQTPHQ